LIDENLAKEFVRTKGYNKNTFKGVDVGKELESEVCNWMDELKTTVYEEVCFILKVPE